MGWPFNIVENSGMLYINQKEEKQSISLFWQKFAQLTRLIHNHNAYEQDECANCNQ